MMMVAENALDKRRYLVSFFKEFHTAAKYCTNQRQRHGGSRWREASPPNVMGFIILRSRMSPRNSILIRELDFERSKCLRKSRRDGMTDHRFARRGGAWLKIQLDVRLRGIMVSTRKPSLNPLCRSWFKPIRCPWEDAPSAPVVVPCTFNSSWNPEAKISSEGSGRWYHFFKNVFVMSVMANSPNTRTAWGDREVISEQGMPLPQSPPPSGPLPHQYFNLSACNWTDLKCSSRWRRPSGQPSASRVAILLDICGDRSSTCSRLSHVRSNLCGSYLADSYRWPRVRRLMQMMNGGACSPR